MKAYSNRILEYCKYWDNGNCPYRAAFGAKLDDLTARGKSVDALQPRCPVDAQRSKRGILKCICEKGDKLC